MNLCACIGPAGDCPCIRQAKGLPVPITETYISAELFALLPDEDKQTINDLKSKALGLWIINRKPAADGVVGSGGNAVDAADIDGCIPPSHRGGSEDA
jgi:hypothetical protein